MANHSLRFCIRGDFRGAPTDVWKSRLNRSYFEPMDERCTGIKLTESRGSSPSWAQVGSFLKCICVTDCYTNVTSSGRIYQAQDLAL